MFRTFGIVSAVSLGLSFGVDSAVALGPVYLAPSLNSQYSSVIEASFFGRPYPYGYSGWGRCMRYVPVETPMGLRLRRVRVCR